MTPLEVGLRLVAGLLLSLTNGFFVAIEFARTRVRQYPESGDAFDQFQAQDQELALVLEDGEVIGLVTAADALEAVMGELEDPLDRAYGEAGGGR